MWKKAVLTLCISAAAGGCTKLTAPDGIQVVGVNKLTPMATCQVVMPDGYLGEKGSEPDLNSCTVDLRIRP
jgi:hypothetical protein